MSKKHKLKIQKKSEKKSNDFVAYGISSAEKDYRLAYFIGKGQKIKLEKTSEILEASEVYIYKDEQQKRKLCFFPNRQTNGFLIQQLKEADYFALVYCLEEDNFAEEVREALNSLPVIQSLFQVPEKQQKFLASLIEDNH
jgi:hypothetical protein